MEYKNENQKRERRHRSYQNMSKIDRILIDIQRQLLTSYQSASLDNLTAYERKRIHSFFDNKPEFRTKTYREEDKYILKVFPVGNLKKMAEEKAQQAMETGESVFLEKLGNYERFIIHDHLKNFEGIETISSGEGCERKLEIKPKQFGRTLKKIIKKIKLFN